MKDLPYSVYIKDSFLSNCLWQPLHTQLLLWTAHGDSAVRFSNPKSSLISTIQDDSHDGCFLTIVLLIFAEKYIKVFFEASQLGWIFIICVFKHFPFLQDGTFCLCCDIFSFSSFSRHFFLYPGVWFQSSGSLSCLLYSPYSLKYTNTTFVLY